MTKVKPKQKLKNTVFEVMSNNLDIRKEEEFSSGLWSTKEKAWQKARSIISGYDDSKVVEDFEGKLTEYDGVKLKYNTCEGKPAIYSRSYFGSFASVIYIRERTVN